MRIEPYALPEPLPNEQEMFHALLPHFGVTVIVAFVMPLCSPIVNAFDAFVIDVHV
jgi:hypothetical protein